MKRKKRVRFVVDEGFKRSVENGIRHVEEITREVNERLNASFRREQRKGGSLSAFDGIEHPRSKWNSQEDS